jgi:hypothetical protein
VQDNLNTHHPSSLYEACAPAEAKALLDRCAFHYTPKHGSWLNMAEIDAVPCNGNVWIGVFLIKKPFRVQWRFTTADARIRLERLYPSVKN